MDITKLAQELKAQGVDTFEIRFTFQRDLPVFKTEKTEIKSQVEVPISPGLAMTMDAEMDPDKILNWSSPDNDKFITPLTGDAPLVGE